MSRYAAQRLPVHRGPAAWNVILGEQDDPQRLEADTTADITIIGAGFAGLAAARRCRQLQENAKVVVLEAGRIAEGAAGRNSGFMIDLPHELTSHDYAGAGDDRQQIALNRHAITFARQAVNEYGIDANFFDETGKVNGAASSAADARNRSYAAHLDRLGETSEYLDAQAMQQMTGSRHYHSGLYTPGTVMLQPAGFIRGLAAGLRRDENIAVYENSAVLNIEKHGQRWAVITGNGRVSSSKVILAVNGHLESFGIETGRLMQIFLFASMTQELDAANISKLGGTPRWGITPSDPMGTTLRRIDTAQGGNRIVTRTCAVMRPDMQVSRAEVEKARRVHRRKFNDRFPALSGITMEHCWAGHLCLTLNGVSVARELDNGVFSACAQNGLGTTRGILTGIAAADMAYGARSEIADHFAREGPPKPLPPQPFAKWGANGWMRFKEWQARAE